MDKNFINIDDLVRQRLDGAEERERSGAWMRMRELLDKEEPQRPIGFLYWRRIFSAVAILILLTSISVGGYKMSSSLSASNNRPVETAIASSAVSTSAAALTANTTKNLTGKTDLNNNNSIPASPGNSQTGIVNNHNQNNTDNKKIRPEQTHDKKKFAVTDKKENIAEKEKQYTPALVSEQTKNNNPAGIANNKVPGNNEEDAKLYASNNNSDKTNNNNSDKTNLINNEKIATKNKNINETNDINSPVVDKNSKNNTHSLASNNKNKIQQAKTSQPGVTNNQKTVNNTSNNLVVSGNSINAKAPENAKPLAANNLAPDHKSGNASSASTHGNNNKTITKTNNIHKQIAGNTPKQINKNGKTTGLAIASTNIPAINPVAKNNINGKQEHKTAKVKPAAKTTSSKLALSSHAPADNHTNNIAGASSRQSMNTTKKTGVSNTQNNTQKLATAGKKITKNVTKTVALSSHAASKTNDLTGVSSLKKNSRKVAVTRTANVSNQKNTSLAVTSSNTPGKTGAGNAMRPNVNAGPNAGTDNGDNEGSDNTTPSSVAKRDKLTLQKLNIIYRTIKTSSDKNHYIIDTNSINEVSKALVVASEPPANHPGTSRNASNSSSNNSGGNLPSTFIGPPPPPKYLASKYSSKNQEATKGSLKEMGDNALTGKEQLANLNQAFNDIKYKVGAAKFAPGLTAGINGTFFGPNSIKGFQFGVTGDFIFGDTWSVLCELAYFNRVNNGYAINDNYYAPVAGGKYILNSDSYTFPTLQSFELPIAARYHVGNFSFSAGVNLEYSLNINETPSSTPATTTVSTLPIGAESSPKINYNDFNSRFGVGYLVGLAYQVSSNVTLDARNVQTMWDNANSSGSKIVSDQLYKSPSLQLSLIYRFGGKKSKD